MVLASVNWTQIDGSIHRQFKFIFKKKNSLSNPEGGFVDCKWEIFSSFFTSVMLDHVDDIFNLEKRKSLVGWYFKALKIIIIIICHFHLTIISLSIFFPVWNCFNLMGMFSDTIPYYFRFKHFFLPQTNYYYYCYDKVIIISIIVYRWKFPFIVNGRFYFNRKQNNNNLKKKHKWRNFIIIIIIKH